jgi:hypothetical protein
MPGKLKAVLGLFAITAVFGFINGSWFVAAIRALAILLLSRGSDLTRRIVIVLALLGLVWSIVSTLLSLGAIVVLSFAASTESVLKIGEAGLSFVGCIYTVWALTRQDVKDWMLAKASGTGASGN